MEKKILIVDDFYKNFLNVEEQFIQFRRLGKVKTRLEFLTNVLNYPKDEAIEIWKHYKEFLKDK